MISGIRIQQCCNAIKLACTCSVIIMLSLCVTDVSTAQTYLVNSTVDAIDVNTGDGICADASGNCTLRAAVMETNALTGFQIIRLPAGIFTLTNHGTNENGSITGDLDITDEVTISGTGVASTIIDGDNTDRVIEVLGDATLHVNGVRIQNGKGDGGGILNSGTMTLDISAVVNNTSYSWGGMGIYNIGTMTITDCSVSNNSGTGAGSGGGGGLFNQGTMTLVGTTVSGNTNSGRGGGIYNLDRTLTVINSTISQNTSLNGGGIFNRSGTVHLTNCTINGNTATDDVGGVWIYGGTAHLKNTIISNNIEFQKTLTNYNRDCTGSITSHGYNLISDNSAGLSGAGDLNSTNPMVGPLADNGGLTMSHELLPGARQ